jgi:hypothetical protein
MSQVSDFTQTLRAAFSELKAAGFSQPVATAEARCFSAYATSSEWLGEVGVSITELLSACEPSAPPGARKKLEACLNEVAKVWPKFACK